MRRSVGVIAVTLSFLIMVMFHPVAVLAQEQGTKVRIQVDGLSCPFCAFGLEKRLKKLNGVETVTIQPDRAIVEVLFAPGAVWEPHTIRQAVEAAGFTPRKIQVVDQTGEQSGH